MWGKNAISDPVMIWLQSSPRFCDPSPGKEGRQQGSGSGKMSAGREEVCGYSE